MANPHRGSASKEGNAVQPPPRITRQSEGEGFGLLIAAGTRWSVWLGIDPRRTKQHFSDEGTSSASCYLMLAGGPIFREEDCEARLQCMKLKPSLCFAQNLTQISSKSLITVIFHASAMSLILNYVKVLPICWREKQKDGDGGLVSSVAHWKRQWSTPFHPCSYARVVHWSILHSGSWPSSSWYQTWQ